MHPNERYVIGMDSSTQSVKAIAWTQTGEPRSEGRAAHTLLTPDAYRAEQDADEWWSAAQTALRKCVAGIDPSRIDGVAISNQRETMVLLDDNRRPLAPATVWLDRRARDMTHVLSDEIGRERLHRISGKPVDVIPCVFRLRHYRAHQPELLDRTRHILSVHDFLVMHLTGEPAATWTSADPFGIFDIEAKEWSKPLLDHLGIGLDKLPAAHPPGTMLGRVTADAAAATGLPVGIPVFAAGGDGHCAGLGVSAIDPRTVYLNLGTAVVGGVWSPTPAVSSYWRTLISPTGEGYLLEAVQRAGAFFVNWLIDNFAGGRGDPAIFQRLEHEARGIPVGADGVLACTYLMGCMDPHWDEEARASFVGLGPNHRISHLYRASLEAITLEFARALKQMQAAAPGAEEIYVIGGGAASPLWRKMFADATGFPVRRSLSDEASALGAGISAAVGAGWFDGFRSATTAMSHQAEATEPDLGAHAIWEELSQRQESVYLQSRPRN
jgi:xylulokinase